MAVELTTRLQSLCPDVSGMSEAEAKMAMERFFMIGFEMTGGDLDLMARALKVQRDTLDTALHHLCLNMSYAHHAQGHALEVIAALIGAQTATIRAMVNAYVQRKKPDWAK